MQTYPVAWGLDIGHSSIKAVKLSHQGDKATVLGYTIEPIHVTEDGDRDEAVVNALRSMAIREEFGETPVIAALSGRQVLTRTVNIPMINQKNMERMVELEARQQIPGEFSEIEWGYHPSPAADGASLDVALFAVKREITQDIISKTKQAGVNLVGISVSSLALYNFIRFDQTFPEDEAVIILDVGAENTDLVVYSGDGLWMRTLAVSGNDITKAFMKKFRVSFDEAETLKRQAVDSKQADRIIKVIEGSLNELTSDVQRSLGFYRQQNKEAKLENLVISGSTFRLPGLPEYMAERLRYTVNILEDLDKIQVASGLERDHFMHDLQSLGVAMGLALQGTGAAKAAVDLMPSQLQVERVLRTKRWAGVAMAATLAAAIAVDLVVIGKLATENQALSQDVQKSYKDFEGRQTASNEALGKVPLKAQELKAFDPYGTQQGILYGIADSILGVLQGLVTERGRVNPEPASERERQVAPLMQAVYLRSLDIPEVPWNKASGPFRPLAEALNVTLVVSVPKDARPSEVSRLIVDRLRGLTQPAGVGAARTAKLFTDVQATSERPDQESYSVIDKTNISEKTGEPEPIQEERKILSNVYTIVCTVAPVEAK